MSLEFRPLVNEKLLSLKTALVSPICPVTNGGGANGIEPVLDFGITVVDFGAVVIGPYERGIISALILPI